MTHTHYYQVHAKSHYKMGFQLAKLFKESFFKRFGSEIKKLSSQIQKTSELQLYLQATKKMFPHYIEELKGYADGLGIEFDIFWYIYLSLDIDINEDKCTSCFSADGLIIGHNEDNYDHLNERIAILEKTIDGLTTFELHYYSSLGGDACSINSHGYVQTINTLHHIDHQIGIPRNVIARWLSETKNPNVDYIAMQKMKRSMGYSHTFGNPKGEVVNIESTAKETQFVKPTLPFVHTNHYLTSLSQYEDRKSPGNSSERCHVAAGLIRDVKTAADMMKLLENVSDLESNNQRESKTIARMVFDLKKKEVWCWLQRESSLGWVKYPISFL